MDSLTLNLIIGIASSVLGAIIVYIASYGANFTKKRKLANQEMWNKQKATWLNGDVSSKQEITNNYLFEILRFLFLGSMFGALGTTVDNIEWSGFGFRFSRILMMAIGVFSFILYFIGLGKVLKYMRLRRLNNDEA